MRNKFAWIIYPNSIEDIHYLNKFSTCLLPFLNIFPDQIAERIFEFISPYKFVHFKNIRSEIGRNIDGYGILCPFLLKQKNWISEDKIFDRLFLAGKLAKQCGAGIIALPILTSIVGDKVEILAKKLNLAITNGKNYMAGLIIKGILRASELMEIDLKNASCAVINATSTIGRACTQILANKAHKIIITSYNEERLKIFANFLRNNYYAEIITTRDIGEAIKNADIVLTLTLRTYIEPALLKSGSVLCDATLPFFYISKAATKNRDDILIFEGGWTKLPYPDIKLEKLQPKGMVFACLAEAIILAMEGRFESFSLNKNNVNPDRVEEIVSIGERHGFRLGNFRRAGRTLTKDDIEMIKQKAKENLARNGIAK